MRIAVLILLALCTHSQASKKGIKNTKKIMAVVDDEMALLDALIQDRDIRTHYDISKLNSTLYLPILKHALLYSQGMATGLQIESRVWLAGINANITHSGTSSSTSALKYQIEDKISHSKATSGICIWQLHSTALKKLVQNAQPDPLFFEFIANLFQEIGIIGATEQISNTASRRVLVSRATKCLAGKVNNIISVFDFLYSLTEIDITAPSFPTLLRGAITESIALHRTEYEITHTSSISSATADFLSKLELFRIIFPLIVSNAPFLARLRDLVYPVPAIPKFKEADSFQILQEVSKKYFAQLQGRFMFEHYYLFENNFSDSLVNDLYENGVRDLTYINRALKRHRQGANAFVLSLDDPLYQANSSLFGFSSHASMPTVISTVFNMSETHLTTLEHITLGTLLNSTSAKELEDLTWRSCEKLIIALNGTITEIGVGMRMLTLRGHWIRFDRIHPRKMLGYERALTLRAIFCEWGLC